MKALLFTLALAGALAAAAPQPPTLRLPTDAVPARYQLELTLDPAKTDFSGVVNIELKVAKTTPVIWLNQNSITVTSASIEQTGVQRAAKVVPGGEDFVGFEFEQPVVAGRATLKVAFTGKVNLQASAGLFLSKRNDDSYLFTQFEPVDARSAFPCFDEPGFKVPWQLTLRIPAALTAVSNTPVANEVKEGDMKRVVFRETAPLPSYLIAYGVGPFEFVDAGVAGRKKVPVRIVVPRGDAPRAKYAAEVTAEILTRLEKYFDIPFPYDKSDQLAIPVSFGGAMENPGLVTYDAGIILAPPQGEDTIRRQRSYALVAAHELAHQWFGDLVTMAWWNDTWLNESFATMMEQRLIAEWKPEWNTKVDDQESRTYAMWLDRLATARRIDQPIEAKSDIANAFDGITYQKGGAVLNMFEHRMGAEKFRQAVRFYLTRHAFGNGTTQDFLDALAEMGGESIKTSFRTFLSQAGTPEIPMKLECANGAAKITMAQQRFTPLGAKTPEPQLWKVPVCVAYDDQGKRATACTTLEQAKGELTLKTKGCPAWFFGNAEGAGYYYARYEGDALQTLIKNRDKLTLAELTGLLSELNLLARSARLPLSDGLKLAELLKDEPKHQIADAALTFSGVRVDMLPPALRPKYAEFIRANFGARAHALGWKAKPGESEDDKLLRPSIVSMVAGEGEDAELIAQAKQLTDEWLATRTPMSADIFRTVLRIAARNGDVALYERMLEKAKTEKDEFFKGALIGALQSFRQPELMERNRALALSGTFDFRFGFGLMFSGMGLPGNERIALDWVKAHFDEIVDKLPKSAGSDYAGFLPQSAGRGCSEADAKEAQEFFAPRMAKVAGGPRNLAQTVEDIRLCEARRKVQQPDLVKFFESR